MVPKIKHGTNNQNQFNKNSKKTQFMPTYYFAVLQNAREFHSAPVTCLLYHVAVFLHPPTQILLLPSLTLQPLSLHYFFLLKTIVQIAASTTPHNINKKITNTNLNSTKIKAVNLGAKLSHQTKKPAEQSGYLSSAMICLRTSEKSCFLCILM